MTGRRRRSGRVKGYHYNVAGRRQVAKIEKRLRQGKADELVLTEGYSIVPWLRPIAKRHGYVVKAWPRKRFGPEARDVVLVVRDPIVRHRPMRMSRTWRGIRAGVTRKPRVYHRLVRKGVRSVVYHAPPLPGKNQRAQAETFTRLLNRQEAWIGNGHPNYSVGDANVRAKQLRQIVGSLGKVRSCRKVAHLVTVGCKGSVWPVRNVKGGHGAFRYVVKY